MSIQWGGSTNAWLQHYSHPTQSNVPLHPTRGSWWCFLLLRCPPEGCSKQKTAHQSFSLTYQSRGTPSNKALLQRHTDKVLDLASLTHTKNFIRQNLSQAFNIKPKSQVWWLDIQQWTMITTNQLNWLPDSWKAKSKTKKLTNKIKLTVFQVRSSKTSPQAKLDRNINCSQVFDTQGLRLQWPLVYVAGNTLQVCQPR